MGTWAIKLDLIRDWLDEQDSETAACIKMALEVLKDRGPALGRPLVDTVSYSKYGNMKELRPASPGRKARSGSCLHSIRQGERSCCWRGTRQKARAV